MNIIGPGPDLLAVNGNGVNRVFHVAPSIVVGIYSLTVTNGVVFPCICDNNGGGGIRNDRATLLVSNCTVSGNSAAYGGGIYNNADDGGNPVLIVVNSTVSGNSAGVEGAGIENSGEYGGSANARITNCAIIGNTGGGIVNAGREGGSASLVIANSTLCGNSACNGGGVYNISSATLRIVNSTVSGNLAGCVDSGGGISSLGSATLEIGSTILNAGRTGKNIDASLGTVTSLGYNLSSDDGGGFLTASSDQVNTDPVLGPLQDNGGPTFTYALLCGSPAIDAGKNLSGATTDQRGSGFARTVVDPGVKEPRGGDSTDIGAFEIQETPIQQLLAIQTLVQSLSLDSHVQKLFLGRLRNIKSQLDHGRAKQACIRLRSLVQLAEHELAHDHLTEWQTIQITTPLVRMLTVSCCE